jgi:hypothetical protein
MDFSNLMKIMKNRIFSLPQFHDDDDDDDDFEFFLGRMHERQLFPLISVQMACYPREIQTQNIFLFPHHPVQKVRRKQNWKKFLQRDRHDILIKQLVNMYLIFQLLYSNPKSILISFCLIEFLSPFLKFPIK